MRTQLRAAVEGIGPGDGHGNFGELGRGMRAMAETVHTPMELDLFSDMQESNMPGNFADMVMPGNVDAGAASRWADGGGAELDGRERAGAGAIGGHQEGAGAGGDCGA